MERSRDSGVEANEAAHEQGRRKLCRGNAKLLQSSHPSGPLSSFSPATHPLNIPLVIASVTISKILSTAVCNLGSWTTSSVISAITHNSIKAWKRRFPTTTCDGRGKEEERDDG